MKRLLVLLFAGVVSVMPTPVRADDAPAPRQTLRVLQDLMAGVADSALAIPGAPVDATVRLSIQPALHAWYLDRSVSDAARTRGLVPTESLDARYDIRFGIEQIGVTYANVHRTWVFGEQVMDRNVHIAGTVRIVEKASGTILADRAFHSTTRDTIAVVGAEELETPGIAATHGVFPSSGLFSSLVEPLVLIGSVAVAVYLLFSVRN